MEMKKRVVIGLSGGVDSSVAAHLLIQEGYEVIAIFMRNWVDDEYIISDECPWVEDSNDALIVAQKLGIPFHVIDFSEEYKERIVDYMFTEYEAGRTPNPDVLCNREVKFDLFLKKAIALGADYVATGHYCQKKTSIENGETIHHLIAGADENKDQSYFLCQVNQEQLSKALFPIGHLQKKKVREIASELDLVTAEKKDSQGLCFIGKVKLPDFLQQQLKVKKGKVIKIEANHPMFERNWDNLSIEELADNFNYDKSKGKEIGEHQGAHFFTIGQRKGIGIGGTKEPLFVIEKDTKENILYVGESDVHPGLLRKVLRIQEKEINFLQERYTLKIGDQLQCRARIRYRQPLQNCIICKTKDGLFAKFEEFQKGIAAGQFIAWYINDELIGSGIIA